MKTPHLNVFTLRMPDSWFVTQQAADTEEEDDGEEGAEPLLASPHALRNKWALTVISLCAS